jgi:peptidoglycan/LPS O-acetylase OafA/YrhL
MAAAVVRVRWEDGHFAPTRLWRPVAWLAVAVLLLGALKLYYSGTLSFLEYQTPIAAACGLVLALVVLADRSSPLVRLLGQRHMVAAGLASYSVFLWHDPLVRSFRDWGLTLDGSGGFVANLLLIGAVSGIASAATYRFVEKPALARKRSWQRESAPSAPEPAPAPEADLVPAPAPSAAR